MKKSHAILTVAEYKCHDKKHYASERIAKIRAEHRSSEVGVPLFTYKCPLCKSWHLTRLPQRA